jgi:hypothetical protein
MLAAIFASPARYVPYAALEIEFAPCHAADLFSSLAGHNQQSHNFTEIVVTGGLPDCKHPLTRRRRLRFGRAEGRIRLREPVLHRPAEQCREGRAGSCCGDHPVLPPDDQDAGGNIAARNCVDRDVM